MKNIVIVAILALMAAGGAIVACGGDQNMPAAPSGMPSAAPEAPAAPSAPAAPAAPAPSK